MSEAANFSDSALPMQRLHSPWPYAGYIQTDCGFAFKKMRGINAFMSGRMPGSAISCAPEKEG